jgi:hypothetical protein
MLERESAFYEAHQAEYRGKYLRKWLIIADGGLFGVYDTPGDAVTAALKRYNYGEFLLNRPADDDMVLEFGPMGVVHAHRPHDTKKPKPASLTTTSGDGLLTIPYA